MYFEHICGSVDYMIIDNNFVKVVQTKTVDMFVKLNVLYISLKIYICKIYHMYNSFLVKKNVQGKSTVKFHFILSTQYTVRSSNSRDECTIKMALTRNCPYKETTE